MKSVIFLADGMADEPLEELGGKTPLEYAKTPYMDYIAKNGISGTFLTLPENLPTSSDVANMSVLGFTPEDNYPGRGPIEAVSQGIDLKADDVAWRCNIVTVDNDGVMLDYSAGHIGNDDAKQIMEDLEKEFGNDKVTFYSGVSYRNLLVLHGEEFSKMVDYHKPDSSHGLNEKDLGLTALDQKAQYTVDFLNELCAKAKDFLAKHPLNQNREFPANRIWPWSPGYKPTIAPFVEKYQGKTGAIISAVDVIKGLGIASNMEVIEVEGATGYIDTNYENKAYAALKALDDHDFVYIHVEGIDEVSHLGDLELKLKAIEDFDERCVKIVVEALKNSDVRMAILPDHPVPIKLRLHTTTPVPFAVCGSGITADSIDTYTEGNAPKGNAGFLKKDELMKLVLGL